MTNVSKFIICLGLILTGFYVTLEAKALVVKEESFNNTIASGIVVVDFYADWCGPCKKFGPIFEKMSEEMADHVTFVKFNVDQGDKILDKYNIQYIPTVVMFKDGAEVARNDGFMDAKALRSFILDNL